jgi:hypothetical protein
MLSMEMELVFKEKERRSPAEETVDEKIKSRIAELINVTADKISADKSGNWVKLPIQTVLALDAIIEMRPTGRRPQIFEKGRRPQIFEKGRQPYSFFKWTMTSKK